MTQSSSPTLNRRRMFAATGAVGAVAAVAAVAPAIQPQAPVVAQPKVAPKRGGGYNVSEHIERYYKTARV